MIHLKSDIVGAGQAGDVIIHNPDHPNPALRLCRVVPIDAGLLSVIKESVSEEPSASEANDAASKTISEDWARVEAIQTFRPLGQLGRELKDRKFEHDETGDCPRLDDPGVAYDISFAAAVHLKRWSEMEPVDDLGGAWLTLKATLVVFHVLADRLAIASHSTRSPKYEFGSGVIPETEVLNALDVLMRNATVTYGDGGEWLS